MIQSSFPSLPAHLASTQPAGMRENEPVAQFEIGSHRNFIYLLLDWSSREAMVVDPQADLAPILEPIRKFRFQLRGILLTHTHFDHVAGVPELLERFPRLRLHVNEADLHRIESRIAPGTLLEKVRDQQSIQLGGITIQVLHTPGHSSGECCYFVPGTKPPYLFTGDTVFIRDCGRTDFADGSDEQMFSSLQRIKKLPAGTVILPGHHYKPECASTLARESVESAPMRCRRVEELAALP